MHKLVGLQPRKFLDFQNIFQLFYYIFVVNCNVNGATIIIIIVSPHNLVYTFPHSILLNSKNENYIEFTEGNITRESKFFNIRFKYC